MQGIRGWFGRERGKKWLVKSPKESALKVKRV